MRSFLLVFGLGLVLQAQGLYSACRITEITGAQGITSIVLENDFIRASVLPSSCARLSSLILKSTKEEFFTPLEESTTEISPLLPRSVRSNGAGFKDWIWGSTTPSGTPFVSRILASGPDEVCVELTGTLAVFDVKKVFRLRQDSAILAQEITISNPTDQRLDLDYWAHLMVNPKIFSSGQPTKSVVVAALDTNPTILRGKKTETFGERGVFTGTVGSSYHFIAPIEPWVAKVSSISKSALVLRFGPFVPGKVLASVWQSEAASSLEVIFPSKELAPQEGKTFSLDLAIAPRVGELLGVVGDFLICVPEDKVGLLPLTNVPETKWQLPSRDKTMDVLSVPRLESLTFHPFGPRQNFLAGQISLNQGAHRIHGLFSPDPSHRSFSEQ